MPIACRHTYTESYCSSGKLIAIKTLFEHPSRRHIFANTVGRICKLNLTLRHNLLRSAIDKLQSTAKICS